MSHRWKLNPAKLWIYCRAPFYIWLYGMVVSAVFLPSYIINPNRCGHSVSILSSCVKENEVDG